MATILSRIPAPVAQNPRFVLQAADALRDEAALVMRDALEDGASVKRVRTARVPGVGPSYLSRAMNGGDSNPLYRVASLFMLMKRLGMGRDRAQRIINWLQEVVDSIWPVEDAGSLRDVLEKDQEHDVQDDTLRYRAAMGCVDAARELLAVKRRQAAFGPVVVIALRRRVAEVGQA